MKKITLLMALALVLAATGCGKKDVAEPTPAPEASMGQEEVVGTTEPTEAPEESEAPTTNPTKAPQTQTTKAPTKAPATEATKAPIAEPTPVVTPAPTQAQAPTPAPTPVQDTRPLGDLMAKITSNLGEMPMTETHTLDAETFEFFTFAEYVEGAEAVASEPMMSSIAHSVVLVRLPNGADASAFASKMKANADPRKWLCVEAEKVATASKGNLAILVMSASDKADQIIANFKNL